MADRRRALGRAAEDAAAACLQRAGLSVVGRNVRFRAGELDLVCRDGNRWVFVEVKARWHGWGDPPAAAIGWRKRRRIVRLAQLYLRANGLGEPPCRFDVVAVTLGPLGVDTVQHLPAAFDAS